MAMGQVSGKKGVRNEINITPYIDILLVLLIIFMVTHPMQSYDLPIRVPQPPPPVQEKEKTKPDFIIVDVLKDRTFQLNSTPITLPELGDRLKQVFALRPNRNMFVRAYPQLAFGEVFPVLDVSQQAGAHNIALIKGEEAK